MSNPTQAFVEIPEYSIYPSKSTRVPLGKDEPQGGLTLSSLANGSLAAGIAVGMFVWVGIRTCVGVSVLVGVGGNEVVDGTVSVMVDVLVVSGSGVGLAAEMSANVTAQRKPNR